MNLKFSISRVSPFCQTFFTRVPWNRLTLTRGGRSYWRLSQGVLQSGVAGNWRTWQSQTT